MADAPALLELINTARSDCPTCEGADTASAPAKQWRPYASPPPRHWYESGALRAAATDAPAEGDPSTRVSWTGVLGIEGELTGDGRLIEKNALRWENLPLPLRYVASDVGMHEGAVVVGGITAIRRTNSGAIEADGFLDTGSPAGQEAVRQVGEGLTTGVSMDLDDVSFELRIAAELLDDDGPLGGLLLASKSEEEPDAEEPPGLPEPDKDGRITVAEIGSDDEVRVMTSGRIRASTIVAIPAFADAQIHLVAGPEGSEQDVPVQANSATPRAPEGRALDAHEPALVASGGPARPPRAWFGDPKLPGPTALVVTDDGHVYGHLATWDTCHISHTNEGRCVRPPHSTRRYAYFLTGTVLTDGASNGDSAEVAVGHITLDTRHAGAHLTPALAVRHYEDTGAVVADISAGEDSYGIWVSGAIRPGVTDRQLRAIRSAPLSGDWRRVGNDLELVAALSVNIPGFPVPRPSGLVAGGHVQSLVASGMLAPRRVIKPEDPAAFLSTEDLGYLKRLISRQREDDTAARALKVTAFGLKRRVERALALAPKG